MIISTATLEEIWDAGVERFAQSKPSQNGLVTAIPHGEVIDAIQWAARKHGKDLDFHAGHLARSGADFVGVWLGRWAGGYYPALGLSTTMTHRGAAYFYAGAVPGADDANPGGVVCLSETARRNDMGKSRDTLRKLMSRAIQWWEGAGAGQVKRSRDRLGKPLTDPGPTLWAAVRRSGTFNYGRKAALLPLARAKEVHLEFTDAKGKTYWDLAEAFMRSEGGCNPAGALARGLAFHDFLWDECKEKRRG